MISYNLIVRDYFSQFRRYKVVLFLIIIINNLVIAQPYEPVEINGRWGYVDEKNILVIDTLFAMAMPFNEYGLASVVDDSGWVYIDTCGHILFRPFVYDNGPDYFSDGLSRYTKNNKIGFVNDRGEIWIIARFDFAMPFSEGYAAFCEGCEIQIEGEHKMVMRGKWGYMNKEGEVVLEAKYDRADPFRNGKASVMIKDNVHIIDTQGKRIN